jgi:soluble lytic murein transglycosylase
LGSDQEERAEQKLDPYLVAALMAQESTFVRDIKSHAGAYGLMQMMPSNRTANTPRSSSCATR